MLTLVWNTLAGLKYGSSPVCEDLKGEAARWDVAGIDVHGNMLWL
jgi:hypothetical protein